MWIHHLTPLTSWRRLTKTLQMIADAQRHQIISQTKTWLEKVVIGLNLCPFARAVHVKNQIRYLISEAKTADELMSDLQSELGFLKKADPLITDTTLIIHPHVLTEFVDYNQFLGRADKKVKDLKLEDVIQIASFHPQYRFADMTEDAIENHSNRSPYPMLHLLREESISLAVGAFPDASEIPTKNVETLQKLGHEGLKRLLSE